MAGRALVLFVYLSISTYIFEHGPHMLSAQMTGGNIAVETMMCSNLPNICPCNANNLQVSASKALVCGASQKIATMAALPAIQPPTGVTIDQNALYMILILDRDPPSRKAHIMRYWLHGLFSNITAADMAKGDIAKGTALMTYNGPAPPLDSGAHSYQILLLKQDSAVGAGNMQGVPDVNRGQFDAESFLNTNKMCGDGQLIGAFEFHCSNPDGADPKNPNRQCPDPPLDASVATTGGVTASTTTERSGSSACGDILPALVAAVLFRVLLI